MTARRRRLVLALAAAALAVAVLVAILISAGGSGGNTELVKPQETQPAEARAAIAKTAIAYQRAVDPASSEDPCRFMTNEAADEVLVYADPGVGARGCQVALRESERRQAHPLYAARPLGVMEIRFVPRTPVAGLQGTAAGAQATWRGDRTRSATFVERDGTWLIAK
jgi:hypothetical protein